MFSFLLFVLSVAILLKKNHSVLFAGIFAFLWILLNDVPTVLKRVKDFVFAV
jgi:hypothetical protein